MMTPIAPELIQKLRQLPPDKVAEVEEFVDFLRARDFFFQDKAQHDKEKKAQGDDGP